MCANQCHNGHDVVEQDTIGHVNSKQKQRTGGRKDKKEICECAHKHPKIKPLSKAFKQSGLTELQQQLLSKVMRKSRFQALNQDHLTEAIKNMDSQELKERLEYFDSKESEDSD